eukprot:scaffold181402_cov22-Tisochrysis_lutea.AAC.1
MDEQEHRDTRAALLTQVWVSRSNMESAQLKHNDTSAARVGQDQCSNTEHDGRVSLFMPTRGTCRSQVRDAHYVRACCHNWP